MPQFLLYTYMENVSVLSYSVESELGLQRKRREKCGANCFILIRFGAQSEFHDRKCIKKRKRKRKESEAQSPVSFDYLFFVLLLFPLFVHNKYLTSTPPFLFLYRIKMEDSLFPYVYISLRDCLHKREVEGTRQKEKREKERESSLFSFKSNPSPLIDSARARRRRTVCTPSRANCSNTSASAGTFWRQDPNRDRVVRPIHPSFALAETLQ